ncbi:MAG TPA: hypothetical protein VL329_07435 [Nitrospiraceae bacterium]|jgi:hypothetical protein|nr:hypothetical protein [Nitrospiraceae bacterium]
MNILTIRSAIRVMAILIICYVTPSHGLAFAADSVSDPSSGSAQDLQIEITKKGLGKEVLLRQGVKEWFMLVEVTPENTVVIRQEKENDAYLVDESETHDRPLTATEVDTVIDDFVNSVKTQTKVKR